MKLQHDNESNDDNEGEIVNLIVLMLMYKKIPITRRVGESI